MKVIVHIGAEKTGSTSIQEYLYDNISLLSNAGFYYYCSSVYKNSRALPAYCMDDHIYDDFLRNKGIRSVQKKIDFKHEFLKNFSAEMKSVPKKIHTVIISSEHLHSRLRSQEEVGNVRELLSPFFSDVKIVCYIREQVRTCTSLYSTAIKIG